jgi:hypothetical protein
MGQRLTAKTVAHQVTLDSKLSSYTILSHWRGMMYRESL